ncbi:unnamed protein product [Dovyalis caffra]|uniref:Uncharacterized protein n=1 Tax=Dovyalis caffra TaxID=77055 RepID=A0AAV1SQD1_9ROSI|nr:unnamed protein product [Dovyalis caffra]
MNEEILKVSLCYRNRETLEMWSSVMVEDVYQLNPGCVSGKIRRFMDNKAAGKEVSQELARESLIGISYCLPDKILNSEVVPQAVNGEEKLPVINGDEAEKYRSELISISYSQSTYPATSPVALENNEG